MLITGARYKISYTHINPSICGCKTLYSALGKTRKLGERAKSHRIARSMIYEPASESDRRVYDAGAALVDRI